MELPNLYYIYLLRDPKNRPTYVGQTSDPQRRERQHEPRFYDSMTMEIVHRCYGRAAANLWEVHYIAKFDTYNNGCNRNRGGDYWTHAEKREREITAKKQATAEKARATRQRNKTELSPSQNTLFGTD